MAATKQDDAVIRMQNDGSTIPLKCALGLNKDKNLYNFVTKQTLGKIWFSNFTAAQCKLYLQKLINVAQTADQTGPTLCNEHELILDSCTLDMECFYLLAVLEGLLLFEVLGISTTCKVMTSHDVLEDLISCLSRLELIHLCVQRSSYREHLSGRTYQEISTLYYCVNFGIDMAKLAEKPVTTTEDDANLVTTPIVLHDPTVDGVFAVENLLVTAAIQLPTLTILNIGPQLVFYSEPFTDRLFETLMKRPVNSQSLQLDAFPNDAESMMKYLAVFNEKKITNLSIFVEVANETTAAMLQQALTVIGNSIHLYEFYYELACVNEGTMDLTLSFFQKLRGIASRLKSPMIFHFKILDMHFGIDDEDNDDEDEEDNIDRMTEIERLLMETRHIQDLIMQGKDLQNLALLVYAKTSEKVPVSSVRMLTKDILRKLREYLPCDELNWADIWQ